VGCRPQTASRNQQIFQEGTFKSRLIGKSSGRRETRACVSRPFSKAHRGTIRTNVLQVAKEQIQRRPSLLNYIGFFANRKTNSA